MLFLLLVSVVFFSELSITIVILHVHMQQFGQRKIDIDVAGKASYKLSNLTSLPSFL